MSNKKFSAVEKSIFIAFYKLYDFPNAKTLARRAKISRSTFYRHHRAPQFIPTDYINYLLKSYSRSMNKFLKTQNISLKTIFLRMLIFIYNYRELIRALFKDGHKDIIKDMTDKIKIQVLASWRFSTCPDKFYTVYQNEILGAIELWAKQNFVIENLDEVLDDILYLTRTSPKRLSRFLKS